MQTLYVEISKRPASTFTVIKIIYIYKFLAQYKTRELEFDTKFLKDVLKEEWVIKHKVIASKWLCKWFIE